MNTAGLRAMRGIVALGSAVSLGVAGLGVASAEGSEEPQWDFGTCGKMHMIAVNSANDSVFDRNSDEDAGFFADNITLPVLERVGQPASGDGSGGITDDRDTDWGTADWGTENTSAQGWWSQDSTTSGAPGDDGFSSMTTVDKTTESAAPSSESGGAGESTEKWLTRTYINVDSLGDQVDTGGAVTAVNEALGKIARSCPDTRVILTGFSEGAQVASLVARQIGAGEGAVDASKIAGVALFSDPLRDDNQPVVASGADLPEGMETGEPGGADSTPQRSDDDEGAPVSTGVTTAPATTESTTTSAAMAPASASSTTDTTTAVAMTLPSSATEGTGASSTQVRRWEGQPGSKLGSFAGGQAPRAGAGISGLTSGLDGFGDLAAKTVSWCIDGDLVCGMPEGSATRTIVDAVAPQVNADNPVESLMAVADTLGPAVILGGLESVAEDVSFGPGGFQVARASNPDETLIGRIATEAQRADSRSLGDMGARVLAASSKIAGMGLAAGITVARKTLTPSNLAAISAAGTSDPLLGIGVATAKFAEAALETVSMETATGVAGRVFDEVQAAGLNEQAIAQVATDAATWARLASSDSYSQVPVTSDGRSATAATVDWISALAGAESAAPAGLQAAGFDSAGAKDFLTHLAA